MQVKATKAMTAAINKCSGKGEFKAHYVTLTPAQYSIIVGDPFRNEMHDFNPATGKMCAIMIEYPPEEYAPERYVTSRDLIRIFHDSDRTIQGFFDQVYQALRI